MAASGIIYRAAVPLDCSNIARLIKAAWDESQAAFAAQVSDQRTVEFIAEVLQTSFVVVADLSGRIVGALACTPMRERWSRSDDWLLCDEFFVVSSHHVARVADPLLAQAEAFSDARQLPLVMGGSLMTTVPLEPLLNLRPGYRRVVAQWLRMPKVMSDEPATAIEAHTA